MEDTKGECKSNGKKKREDKIRRRDNRSLENVLKSLSSLPEGEKFNMLQEKYEQLYEEHRTLQNNLTTVEKKVSILQREKDQLQSEHSKSVLARSRLESLCRELQRQNKLIKEENIAKIREEEELRKEVVAKFQTTLTELSNVMQENSEKNLKLRDDNLDMANKITSLCKEFETGQEELARMGKQMSLEKQLSEATLTKMQYEHLAEREHWLKEKELLQNNLHKSEETVNRLQTNIKSLETHLQMYTGKYEEFETTISKSNQVFDNCKFEMVKMTKQINVLEKELKTWKSRWEKNAKAVIELTANKQLQEIEICNSEKKIEQLQKLCRQLQVDRAAYLKLLKVNGIEPSSQICIDTTSVMPSQSKPTKKEQELEVLKNNLKVLQEQFAGLSGKNVDISAEPPDSNHTINTNDDGCEVKPDAPILIEVVDHQDQLIPTVECVSQLQTELDVDEVSVECGTKPNENTSELETSPIITNIHNSEDTKSLSDANESTVN